ncbi:MAG: hypothetical protein ACTTJH_08160 [Bacteroidales bacterium]
MNKIGKIVVGIFFLFVIIGCFYYMNKPICFETKYGICVTWKGKYFMPYRYTNILFSPKDNYIKLKTETKGLDLSFINKKTFIISCLDKDDYEIKMTDFNCLIDEKYVSWDNINYKVRFVFNYINGYRHPDIYLREDKSDICYIVDNFDNIFDVFNYDSRYSILHPYRPSKFKDLVRISDNRLKNSRSIHMNTIYSCRNYYAHYIRYLPKELENVVNTE